MAQYDVFFNFDASTKIKFWLWWKLEQASTACLAILDALTQIWIYLKCYHQNVHCVPLFVFTA